MNPEHLPQRPALHGPKRRHLVQRETCGSTHKRPFITLWNLRFLSHPHGPLGTQSLRGLSEAKLAPLDMCRIQISGLCPMAALRIPLLQVATIYFGANSLQCQGFKPRRRTIDAIIAITANRMITALTTNDFHCRWQKLSDYARLSDLYKEWEEGVEYEGQNKKTPPLKQLEQDLAEDKQPYRSGYIPDVHQKSSISWRG